MITEPKPFKAESASPSALNGFSLPETNPPSPTPPEPSEPARNSARLRRVIVVVSLAVIGVAFCLAATYTPWYREWRLSRASLTALLRESGTPRGGYDPILLYYLGRRLNEQERFSQADPVLGRAVGLDGNSARLRDEWARALLGSGSTTAAFGQLREFAGTHPDSSNAHFILGKFYITQHSMKRAIEELNRAVTLDPASGEAWANLSVAQNEMGSKGPALSAAQKAVTLRPRDPGDRLRLALLFSAPGTPDAARREFEEAVRLGPDLEETHRAFASWLVQSGSQAGDLERAETEARAALRIAPENSEVCVAIGRVLFQRGKLQEAREPLQKAASLAPFDPAAPGLLAQVARRSGDYPAAARWEAESRKRQAHVSTKRAALTAILADPNKPGPHRQMARLLAVEGDVEGCVRDHARALRAPFDSPPALAAAAKDLSAAGFAKEGLPLAQRAVSLTEASPAAQEALGYALLGTGKARDAAAAFDKACTFWPERFPIYKKRLAQYYQSAGRAKSATLAQVPSTLAEKAYQKSREIIGSQVGPILITKEAIERASEAVRLEPNNARYLRHLLRLQFGVNKSADNKGATTTAKQILAIEPGDARTHALLAVLLVDSATTAADFAQVQSHLDAAANAPEVAATHSYGVGLLALRRHQGADAVRALKYAIQLDPEPEVTYYKLFLAYQMVGDKTAGAKAMSESRRRHEESASEAEALRNLALHTDRPEAFEQTAAVFAAHGRAAQARAIRAAAPRSSSVTNSTTPSAPSGR